MALFKIFKGNSGTLNTQKAKEGYAYFTPDTGHLYIDISGDGTSAATVGYTNANNANRIKVAAGIADKVQKALTFKTDGSGADPASSTVTFDGSNAYTISYNSVGAASAGHQHAVTITAPTTGTSSATGTFGGRIQIKVGNNSAIFTLPSLAGSGSATTAAKSDHTHATLTITGGSNSTKAVEYTPGSSTATTLTISGSNGIAVNGGAGTLTINGDHTQAVAKGGTNITSYTLGDILYASANTTLAKLGGNTTTTRKFLRSVATTSGTAAAPAWDTVTKTDVGLSNVTNDAQIAKSVLSGAFDILYSSAANTPARLAANTTATRKFLRMVGTGSAGAAPAWDTVTKTDVGLNNVTNDAQVKASLGTTKGDMLYWAASASPARLAIGTAGYFLKATANGPVWANTTDITALGKVTTGEWSATTIAIAKGGTGATSVNAFGVVYGNAGADGYASTAAGTAQYLLQANGADAAPSWIQSTNSATGSTIVRRDGNGDFSSRWITATRIIATSTTDATGTTAANVALITGNATGQHLEIDNNEIQSKESGTTVGALSLNYDGGNITLGVNNATYNVAIRSTMTSTSKTTGALTIAGGLGVNGDTWSTKYNGLTLTANATGFAIAGGSTTSKTLTVPESYTLAAACAKGVTDSSSASAISTGTSLPTERDIYYGLPTINNSHAYTSSTTIYAPSGAGTSGQFLKSAGGTSAPTWSALPTASTTAAGIIQIGTAATNAAAGNHTHSIYVLRAGDSSITGDLNASKAGNIAMTVSNTNSGSNKVGIYASTNMGLYSWAYTNATTTTSYSAGWIVYRAYDGGYAASSFQLRSAVWNDYAEFRTANENIQPGYVVIDTDNGTMFKTSKRLMPGAQIVSDTFGFAIGETEESKTPVAVSGRVLAYTYRSREEYHAGMAVCSAPNGTIDIMTREEIMMYPDAIIGIVSEIPTYDIWHAGSKEDPHEIQVNGRIWIKVR